MSKDGAFFLTITATIVAVFLGACGAAMWRHAPFAAEEAMGKGLSVLAGATAIVAFGAFIDVISTRLEGDAQQPSNLDRSDWDDA